MNIQEARKPGSMTFGKTDFALLSYYSSENAESSSDGPTITTINAPSVLIEKEHGKAEAVVAPLESDVNAMEDAIRLAKSRSDIVMVHYHLHWVSHSRAWPIPDTVPPRISIPFSIERLMRVQILSLEMVLTFCGE